MTISRTILMAIIFSLALQGLASSAFAEGDAVNGAQLARHWCASCHLVGPGANASASDTAPPFTEIAKDPAQSAERLRGWLSQPHPSMPDLMLTRQENDDLVAYLTSLKSK